MPLSSATLQNVGVVEKTKKREREIDGERERERSIKKKTGLAPHWSTTSLKSHICRLHHTSAEHINGACTSSDTNVKETALMPT